MRENIIQGGTRGEGQRIYIESDWFSRGLPANITLAQNVYIDTSYGFTGFHSEEEEGLFIDEGTGSYDRSSFIVSKTGCIRVGKFTILNGTNIICKNSITIGDHCMISWNTVITDSWIDGTTDSIAVRKALLQAAAQDPLRRYPFPQHSLPVVLEDNCWVGFGSVILPGVRLGRGCIVGCNTIISTHVPPYAIVAGNPAKIIRYLYADDSDDVKRKAIEKYQIK